MTGKQVRVDVTAAEYFLINLKDLIEQYGYSTGHILYQNETAQIEDDSKTKIADQKREGK